MSGTPASLKANKPNRPLRLAPAALIVAMASVTATLLAGCTAAAPRLGEALSASPADCPDELRERVRVVASATAISLPDAVVPQASTGQPQELVARRLLISASPARDVAGVKILGSALTVYVVGGTFAGSASAARNRALEVIPGRLRIDPFFNTSRLHPENLALDVTVLPGGAPADKMTVSLSPLWTPDRHPIPPETLQITLSAQRHLTNFDVVEARARLDVDGTRQKGSRDLWRCSYETRFTLVDHDSVLPALWDLRTGSGRGKPKRWLALFEPALGPFRAIFTSAEAAQAFATWLRVTGATHAGPYQLGLFGADEGKSQSTIPADRDIVNKFRPASVDEVQALTAGRVGEN